MANDPTETLAKAALAALGLLALFIIVGLNFGLQTAFFAFAIFAALSYATDTAGRINVGFVVSLLALLALFVEVFLPASIAGPIAEAVASLGVPVAELNGTLLFFWAAVVILLIWIIDIRFISKTAKKPNTVAKRVTRRSERLVDEYATMFRVIALGVVSIAFVLLDQGAVFAGELGDLVGQSPALASYVVTATAGFLSLGGSLPVVGDLPLLGSLSAGGFAVLAAALFLLAVAVKNQ